MSQDPETNPSPIPPLRSLNAEDATALEAVLLERGLADAGSLRLPAEQVADAQRVERVRALLAMLDRDRLDEHSDLHSSRPADADASDPGGEDLTARTLSRIAAAPRPAASASARPATLDPADALALDALLAARAVNPDADGSSGPRPAGAGERTAQLAALLSLLDRDRPIAEAAPEPGLTDRALERVRAARQRQRFAEQIDMLRQGPRSAGVSLRQVAAAAAVFLLGVSLLLPMLERNRSNAQQAACAANLGLAGMAFNSYATDHAGVLPRGKSLPGTPWWNVGRPNAVLPDGTVFSNSAHLYTLVRSGYIAADKLACRTNAYAPGNGQMTVQQLDWSRPLDVSYSYQNQFTPQPLHVEAARPTLVILADKNPLFVPRDGRIVFDPDVAPDAPSRLHGGDGQNALAIDGAARWTTTPTFTDAGEVEAAEADAGTAADTSGVSGGGDNFWVVTGKDAGYRYTGTELPAGVASDAFLVP